MNEEEEKKTKKRLLLLLLLLLLFIAAIIGTVVFLKDDGTAKASGDEISISSTQETKTNDEETEKTEEVNANNEETQIMTKLFALNKTKSKKVKSNVTNVVNSEAKNNQVTKDNNAPEISGIENNKWYGNSVSVTIKDESEYTAILTDEDGNSVPYVSGSEITEEGKYTLTVTDSEGNETSVTFGIDKTAPVVTEVPELTNQDVTPRIEDLTEVKATLNGEDYTIGTPITEDGNYELVVTDEAGNSTTVQFVIDKTAPIVLLKDVQSDFYYETIEADKNAEYTDSGAIVTDNVDPDTEIAEATDISYIRLFAFPKLVSKVNMGKPGIYMLRYEYTDAAGNTGVATRIVRVQDTTKPIINLNGETNITIEAGIETYTEQGATVTDNVDSTINNLKPAYILRYGRFATIVRNIDTTKPGSYGVVYFYMDSSGNMAMVTRNVKVVDTTKPTVLLKDVQRAYYEETIEADKTAEYVDAGATVTDNVDPDTIIPAATNINYISADGTVTPVSKVDMGVPGEYRLGYTYTDAAGNKAMARRIVKVVDTTKPTVLLKDVQRVYYEETIEADKTAEYVDAGATVTDNVDPDTIIPTATNINYISADGTVTPVSKVDMGVPGEYRLGYTYTDAAGNKAMARRIVKVVDTTKPEITLNGEARITIEAGIETYIEEGATVTDNVDETITNLQPSYINYSVNGNFVGKVSEVNTLKPGTYKVVYEYTDAAGNKGVDATRPDHEYVIRAVTVQDTTKPVITLNGESKITIEAGIDTYTEQGATVTDNVDETITNLQPAYIHYSVDGSFVGKVESVDTTKPGTYKLVYEYTDAAGNKGVDATRPDHEYVIRAVTVQDTTAPVITLNGESKVFIEAGIDTYTEQGATVTDNVDETITNLQPSYINYSVDGRFVGKVESIDTTKLGTYKVVYEYTDAAGNKGVDATRPDHKYAMRTVTVQDTTAPTITVKDGYVGDKDAKAFSKVSFSLYDKYGVTAYKINNGEYTNVTVNKWSDANFDNIKSRLINGSNTITVKDTSGNEATYTFVYDTIAPILNITGNPTVWQNTDAILSISAIDNESGIKSLIVNGTDITGQLTYNASSNGTYEFVAKDFVGNTVTQTVVVNRIDKTAPTVNANRQWFYLNINASDSESGIKSVVVNGQDVTSTLNYGIYFYWITNPWQNLTVVVTDNANNTTTYNA